jgi:hypothetical protein
VVRYLSWWVFDNFLNRIRNYFSIKCVYIGLLVSMTLYYNFLKLDYYDTFYYLGVK